MRLLIQLKREGRLTWQENYCRRFTGKFPRRSQGSLQVRYHTEVKEKETGWADGGCFGHARADLSLGNVTFAMLRHCYRFGSVISLSMTVWINTCYSNPIPGFEMLNREILTATGYILDQVLSRYIL